MMHGGRTVESGSPEKVPRAPSHPYTRALRVVGPAHQTACHLSVTISQTMQTEEIFNAA
jgi:ABC-type dipeptide/oligopeptide/nickel transport system ATPase component